MNVRLQVIGYALRAVADEMGAALVRSAFSANIKERRDCSTAIFDASGRMVAQAEHIPVHLGAMPASVEAVLVCDPGPADVFILNDPYAGGFVTRHYGRPRDGVHALQIEISRGLYMDEARIEKRPEFGQVRAHLSALAARLAIAGTRALHAAAAGRLLDEPGPTAPPGREAVRC